MGHWLPTLCQPGHWELCACYLFNSQNHLRPHNLLCMGSEVRVCRPRGLSREVTAHFSAFILHLQNEPLDHMLFKILTWKLTFVTFLRNISDLTKVKLRPQKTQSWPYNRNLPDFLCPWDSPGKNTGVGCHSLLQWIFLTQGSNLGLLHCKQILYHLSHQRSPDLWVDKFILIPILSTPHSYSSYNYFLFTWFLICLPTRWKL